MGWLRKCHSRASWPLRFQYAWLVLNDYSTARQETARNSYKMGPEKPVTNWATYNPYKYGFIHPSYPFIRSFKGVVTLFITGSGAHLVAILDDGMLTKVALSVTAAYRKCSSPSSQSGIIVAVLHELQQNSRQAC